MEIKKGKINVIIGPSGSGKKELVLKELNLTNYSDLYQKKYQSMLLSDVFSERTKSKKKQVEALHMVGFPDTYLNKKVKEFSNGELKKISIAYILCERTDTYLFMYPEVGLDAKSKTSFIKVLRLLKSRYHKTIVIVGLDSDWVHQFADFLIVVYNGNVVASGSSYDIFCDSKLCKKYKIEIPKIIEFEKTVLRKKKKRIGYRNDIKDLIKDIYRNI